MRSLAIRVLTVYAIGFVVYFLRAAWKASRDGKGNPAIVNASVALMFAPFWPVVALIEIAEIVCRVFASFGNREGGAE